MSSIYIYMYVCMYVGMYVCMYVCLYTGLYTSIYIYISYTFKRYIKVNMCQRKGQIPKRRGTKFYGPFEACERRCQRKDYLSRYLDASMTRWFFDLTAGGRFQILKQNLVNTAEDLNSGKLYTVKWVLNLNMFFVSKS